MTARRPAKRVKVVRGDRTVHDEVITEEPLQIRVDDADVAVTMRTPGHDFELAVGFLVGEGHVRGKDDVVDVKYCVGRDAEQDYNVVTVGLRVPFTGGADRAGAVHSSCGLCGKRSIDAVHVACDGVERGRSIPLGTLLGLPAAMRDDQLLFERTGGVHAAGLFDSSGRLIVVREDVGRHNAADKAIGRALLDGRLPLVDHVLVLSGRASFEMIQKAALAGIGTVVAVSAPSSLAVEAADRLGLTLLGFTTPDGANLYTHPERVA